MAPSTSTGVTGVAAGTPFSSARQPEAPAVRDDGMMDVSELLMPHQGGPSPFGDDQTFPLPAGQMVYNHPAHDEDRDEEKPAHEH
jgi:succinate dehydrogenase / fumarate reductase iron-sulfur subunit